MMPRLLMSALTCFAGVPILAQPADILLGHYEVHIDYEPTPGQVDAGWRFSVSFDADDDFNDAEGITRLDPAEVRLIAAPGTEVTINAATSRLGKVGAPLWLLPQNNVPGMLFLGVRTVIGPGVFQSSVDGFYAPSSLGNIVLEMVAVEGSGPQAGGGLAVWESKALGNLEFHFDSTDGIGSEDRLEPVAVGSHTHYNWGLTRPGSYEVTLRASGRINPWQPNGGQDTSGEATFTFVVPFSGLVSGAAELRLSTSPDLPAAVYHATEGCEYAVDQVALAAGATAEQEAPFEFGLNLVSEAPAAPNRVGIEGEAPVRLPVGIRLQSPALEILQADGPGDVRLEEIIPSQVKVTASAAGIYRMKLRARLRDDLSGAVLSGPAFTLTLLAGLPANYGYPAYADSFERQHGLPVGTLSDARSDYDQDGLLNGIEYQLFWHGFDPAVADAGLLPLPTLDNDGWGLTFLRDTYKDDFQLLGLSLSSNASPDLQRWSQWHTQATSDPGEEAFETGTGEAALGRILRRRLQTEAAQQPGFFRFDLF